MNDPITVTINGKSVSTLPGLPVLAVMWAAGVHQTRKSDHCHEPRGALCGMGVCYECRVTIDGVPQQRACMARTKDRMEIVTDGD